MSEAEKLNLVIDAIKDMVVLAECEPEEIARAAIKALDNYCPGICMRARAGIGMPDRDPPVITSVGRDTFLSVELKTGETRTFSIKDPRK